MKTTIYTLSRIANVSPSTVSKALKNSPELSEEMRREIQKIAAEMNFRPRAVRSKIPCIGVLVQQYENIPLDFNYYLSSVLEGVAEYCHAEKLTMTLISGSAEEWTRYDLVKELGRRGIDGVLAIRTNVESGYLETLEKNRFPYCVINGTAPDRKKSVSVDFSGIGRTAGEYLRGLGHTKTGILVSPSDARGGKERLSGFLEAYPDAAVVREEELELAKPDGFLAGVLGVEKLLERAPGLTAVFATGLEPALGVIDALKRRSVRVPEDISVLSCDDFPVMAYMSPALSTVAVPLKLLGNAAAGKLHRLMRGVVPRATVTRAELSERIIERATTRKLRC